MVISRLFALSCYDYVFVFHSIDWFNNINAERERKTILKKLLCEEGLNFNLFNRDIYYLVKEGRDMSNFDQKEASFY